jgi:lipopolysaccharide biosynthesis glycosyltransferase
MFDNIRTVLDTDPEVPNFKFPDQDFLSHVFRRKWIPLGYHYNALKTLRNCHKPMWRDEDIKNVHYILDKPWSSRIGAGTGPEDEVLHSWWWQAYEELEKSWGDKPGWDVVAATVVRATP